jgi:CelD/BcsL family acetyltransferase involved in cellulose biosynthesis
MEQLAESWRQLESAATVPTVFVRFAWQRAWVRHFVEAGDAPAARRLWILALWDKDQLAGLAPWYLVTRRHYGLRIREVRSLGSPEGGSDHLDILAAPGREQMVGQGIAQALWGELSDQWDRLDLQEIPAHAPVLYHLAGVVEQEGRQIDLMAGPYCPVFHLPETVERVVGGLGTRHREAFRRNLRAVQRLGQVEHRTWRGPDIASHLAPVFRFHQERWPGFDRRVYPFLEEVIVRSSEATGAQLDGLLVDGSLRAGYLHFTSAGRRELFLLGVDPERMAGVNLGKALLGMCLEQAVQDGIREYDFLKGGESYKFDWANGGERALQVAVVRRRAGPVLAWCAGAGKALGRILLR